MRRLWGIFFLVLFVQSSQAVVDKARLRWARTRPVIDSIAIEGNEHFGTAEIKGQLYSRVRNPWLWLKGDRRSRVQRESYGRDTLEIKYLYLSNGFLGVQVEHAFEPIGKDSSALVRISINEGRQLSYGKVDVKGGFPGEFGPNILNIVQELKPGDPINPFELSQVETSIKTYLANNGYPYANVAYFVDTMARLEGCPVTFEVLSDSLLHFGEIAIEGADRFPESAARRELKIVPGDIYRREDVLESQRRLFECGYYSTFSLHQADSVRDRLRPDFLLKLRERKAWHITFKAGAGQSEVRDLQWDLSGAFGQRNFLGSRRWDALVDYSFALGDESRLIANRYRLRFTEPWLLGIRMPLTLTGQVRPRIKDPVQEFYKRSWSVSALITKWFARKLRVTFGTEYEFVKITGASDEIIEFARTLEGNAARRKLYGMFRRDSRNDLFIPTGGSLTEFSADYYGGFLRGDDNFFKLQGSWSRYRRVWPGWISATRLRGGWAEEFGETESVPLDEALYLGGANTVRGFAQGGLGPMRDDGTPEGAQYTAVFNQEFRWKTVQILRIFGRTFRSFPLWQSVFIDVGNGLRNKEEIRFDNFAVAYGTGVQIMSPAGPIRIDYAQVLKTDHFDFASRWHFTILYAF
ncbi:MAG: hypothetical protein DRP45_01710 [Candidatus Zixiibacteriota bacterium]|nr:MAG: hypothetical protein DRP45_01710 [candidate division Zixibacteria bacterium]